MKNRGICNDPTQRTFFHSTCHVDRLIRLSYSEPVLCVWFAKDKGNYGFVEFGKSFLLVRYTGWGKQHDTISLLKRGFNPFF